MAYSALPSVSTGDLWTAANHNTYLRDNFSDHETRVLAAEANITTLQTSGIILVGSSVLASPNATITIAIPSGYTDLRISAMLRCTKVDGYTVSSIMRLNGDSGGNYDANILAVNYGASPTAYANAQYGQTSIFIGEVSAGLAPAAVFSSFTIEIPGYVNTNWNKTIRIVGSAKLAETGAGYLKSYSVEGFWRNSAAITSITITSADEFVINSSVYVYGIK